MVKSVSENAPDPEFPLYTLYTANTDNCDKLSKKGGDSK